MASKKRQDAAKAKEKRQKIIAAVGGVLLLAILAIQVPRTMKMLNAQAPEDAPPPAAAPTTAGVPTDPSVLPTPGMVDGGAAPTASGGGTLVDSDAVPVPDTGQVVTFGRFSSKDPFHQQVSQRPAGATDGTAVSPTPDAPSEDGSAEDGGAPTPGGGEGAPAVPSSPGSTPGVAAGTALISVNGTEEVVQKGADFPKDSPVFKLVSLTATSARIAVAGGAFASGSATVELQRGKVTTLVNTADGTRYELKLVASGG